MAIITQQIRQNADKETKIKDSQAKKLEKKFKKWHKTIVKNFMSTIQKGSPVILLTDEEKKEFKEFILDSHIKTSEKFVKKVSEDISGVNYEIIDAIVLLIISLINDLIDKQSPERNQSIIQTTEKEKERALRIARDSLLAESIGNSDRGAITNQELALTAGNILSIALINRGKMLANSETNWVAEGTREIHVNTVKEPFAAELGKEAVAIETGNQESASKHAKTAAALSAITYSNRAKTIGIAAILAAEMFDADSVETVNRLANKVREQFKIWVTMGDNRVRKTHRAANGQRVLDSQPFEVGSSLLKYPADGSLGASVAEIINCRCYCFYE